MPGSTAGEKYTQNRATIHLHGNNTVWISDGNTHQWITPAGRNHPLPQGRQRAERAGHGHCAATTSRIVDAMTFFYTNAQSARLQFYHDHAMGITRLNVYAGEAAGYVITDAVEQDMINGTNVSGVNIPATPGPPTIESPPWLSAFPWSSRTGPGWTRIQSSLRTPRGTGEQGQETCWEYNRGSYRRPLVPPCLHVRPESVGLRRKSLRPLALWSLVQSADPRVRQWAPRGVHRGRTRSERDTMTRI